MEHNVIKHGMPLLYLTRITTCIYTNKIEEVNSNAVLTHGENQKRRIQRYYLS